MARETAYRLRRKPGADSFAHAWDAVMARAQARRRKVTTDELAERVFTGLLKPAIYRGKHAGTVRKADNSALLRYLALLDRADWRGEPDGERSQGFDDAPASTSRPGRDGQAPSGEQQRDAGAQAAQSSGSLGSSGTSPSAHGASRIHSW